MTASLSPEEIERYARHIVIRDIGGPGQLKLKKAHVTVIGAGGLGSPAILYLAAAGVGTLRIIDDDTVSVSNLQRQIIQKTAAIGERKASVAADAVGSLNPNTAVQTVAKRLTANNAEECLKETHIVIDGTDSLETRTEIATACEQLEIPLVTAAVSVWDGSLTVIAPHRRSEVGTRYPRFGDVFPDAANATALPTCAEVGVVGALTGMLGTMQAMEAIKLITGAGQPLLGRLLLVDALTMRFEVMQL
ncbi:MAG: molybdopterin-synthase adenylyltransferase MoeB [Pseudomonadota bacterium]